MTTHIAWWLKMRLEMHFCVKNDPIGRFHTRDGLYVSVRRIIHLQNPSKLTEKQMDEVRRIVHPKLRPFHFQIKTYYLSDANYTTDNPSLVWIRPLWAFWSSSMTGYKNDLMESKKSTWTTRKTDLNLVRNLLSLSWPSSFLASQHGVFVSATRPNAKGHFYDRSKGGLTVGKCVTLGARGPEFNPRWHRVLVLTSLPSV